MIEIKIPGYKNLHLNHLVLDYNGTLACDGKLLDNVREALNNLSRQIHIHVLTADTFGGATAELSGITCKVSILPHGDQDVGKLRYIEKLGAETTVCIGNGRNDRLMLKGASLGITVVQEEGTAIDAIMAADVVSPDIHAALNLLTYPLRLIATLRS